MCAVAAPVPANADASLLCGSDASTNLDFELRDAFQHAGDADSSPPDASAKIWKSIRATYSSSAKYCSKYSKISPEIAAYTFAIRAAIEHHNDANAWTDDLNLANQLFEKCVTRFYGSARSAACQADLEENIRRKAAWQVAE